MKTYLFLAFLVGNGTGGYLTYRYMSPVVKSAKAALAAIENKATEFKKVI